MIPIDNPIVPKDAKNLIEYVKTTYYAHNTGGFKIFGIETEPEKLDYFLVKLVNMLSGIVLVTPSTYNQKETTITLPEFSSLAELKMKMNLKGIC